MRESQPGTFAEFWPYYVREHRQARTRIWHFVGTTLAIVAVAAAAVLQSGWWLLAAPFCGYAFAWLSHLWVEKNRPATFKYPLWSLLADFKMWALILTGRMRSEVERYVGPP